jgi:rhodanese-related sulfurtransferase
MKPKHTSKPRQALFFILTLLLVITACGPKEDAGESKTPVISGTLVDGYRVLPVQPGAKNLRLTVYRGDYIMFRLDGFPAGAMLSIPSLSVNASLPPTNENAPYFKMKTAGDYPFALGDVDGAIRVVEFDRPQYTEISSEKAAAILKNIQPLLLDVRTRGEYAKGHIEGAELIPVQELQRRIGELSGKKAEPVLIYCATGNRSTVAAKILIDGGFRRIYNLRHGIAEWAASGLPVVR